MSFKKVEEIVREQPVEGVEVAVRRHATVPKESGEKDAAEEETGEKPAEPESGGESTEAKEPAPDAEAEVEAKDAPSETEENAE